MAPRAKSRAHIRSRVAGSPRPPRSPPAPWPAGQREAPHLLHHKSPLNIFYHFTPQPRNDTLRNNLSTRVCFPTCWHLLQFCEALNEPLRCWGEVKNWISESPVVTPSGPTGPNAGQGSASEVGLGPAWGTPAWDPPWSMDGRHPRLLDREFSEPGGPTQEYDTSFILGKKTEIKSGFLAAIFSPFYRYPAKSLFGFFFQPILLKVTKRWALSGFRR